MLAQGIGSIVGRRNWLGVLVAAWLSLAGAMADETCMSPYMAKIT